MTTDEEVVKALQNIVIAFAALAKEWDLRAPKEETMITYQENGCWWANAAGFECSGQTELEAIHALRMEIRRQVQHLERQADELRRYL